MINYKLLIFVLVSGLCIKEVYSQSVGIGTTNPNSDISILHVKVPDPSTKPQGLILPQLTTAQINNIPVSTAGSVANGLVAYDMTTHQIKYYDASVGIWRALDTSSTAAAGVSLWTSLSPTQILSTDSVGISTNSSFVPLELFHVDGIARFDSVIITNGAQDGYVLTSDASGNASWQSSSLADNLGNHTAMEDLDLSNNAILNVNSIDVDSLKTVKVANIDSLNTDSLLISGGNDGDVLIYSSTGVARWSSPSTSIPSDGNGIYDGSGSIVGNTNVNINSDTLFVSMNSSTDGGFGVNTLTNDTAFFISSSGNVGIGTMSPSSALQVVGEVEIEENLYVYGGVITDTLFVDSAYIGNNGTVGQVLTSQGPSKSAVWTSLSSNSIYGGSGSLSGNTEVEMGANTLSFTSSLSNAFIVDTTTLAVDALNNRVGIGTSTPLSNLHLNIDTDTVGILVQGNGNITGMGIVNTSSSGISAILLGSLNDSTFIQFEGGASHKLRIGNDNKANAAISLEADSVLIEDGVLKYVDGNQGAGRVLTSDANGVASWRSLSLNSLWIRTAADVISLTNASDSVGIGTNSPSSKLHVDGDITLGETGGATENAVLIYLINGTGSSSVKGDIVIVSANNSFGLTTMLGHTSAVGIVYEDGVPDGGYCKVAIAGVAEVNTSNGSVVGHHCITSTEEGEALTTPIPTNPGASIGVFLETTTSGTARVLLR